VQAGGTDARAARLPRASRTNIAISTPRRTDSRTISNAKGVLLQKRWSPLSMLRPPYTARTRRILRFLLR